MPPITDFHDSHFIPSEESVHLVEVERVDDEEGSFVSLSRDMDEDFEADHSFFVSFSLENAAKLGAILTALTA